MEWEKRGYKGYIQIVENCSANEELGHFTCGCSNDMSHNRIIDNIYGEQEFYLNDIFKIEEAQGRNFQIF